MLSLWIIMSSTSSNSCLMVNGQHTYPTVCKGYHCTWQSFSVIFVPQLCSSKNRKEQYCADQYGFVRVWAFSCDKLRVVDRAPSTAANRGGCTCFKFDFCRTIVLESSVIIWEQHSLLNTNPYCSQLPHIWHAMNSQHASQKTLPYNAFQLHRLYRKLW